MNFAVKYYSEQIANRTYNEYLTIDALQTELGQFFNTLKFRVTDADSRTRDIYNILIEQASIVNPVVWLDDPEVFISTISANHGKKKIPYVGLAGAVILIAMIIRFVLAKTTPDLITAVLIGIGMIALLVQCILLWISLSAKPTQNVLTQQRVSSAKFKAGLEQLAKKLDSNASSLFHAMREAQTPSVGTHAGDTDLSLVFDLIRLPAAHQNQDVADTIDRYLVAHRITRIDYTEEHAHLFDVMDSNSTMTIVPVLLQDGKCLNRGIACRNMEES